MAIAMKDKGFAQSAELCSNKAVTGWTKIYSTANIMNTK